MVSIHSLLINMIILVYVNITTGVKPTNPPTAAPTSQPSRNPSARPTNMPSLSPSDIPSLSPTHMPSLSPTHMPSLSPTNMSSLSPTNMPSLSPTNMPSLSPTDTPSLSPWTAVPSSSTGISSIDTTSHSLINTSTVIVHCDNSGIISHSEGNQYIIDSIRNDTIWETPITANLPNVNESTIIRVQCTDAGGTGGFIAQINYLQHEYYTTNPIDAGYWRVVQTSSGNTTALIYTQNGNDPWGYTVDNEINSDAYWIWNTESNNWMIFEFNMAHLFPTNSPTKSPTYNPTQSTSFPTLNPTLMPSYALTVLVSSNTPDTTVYNTGYRNTTPSNPTPFPTRYITTDDIIPSTTIYDDINDEEGQESSNYLGKSILIFFSIAGGFVCFILFFMCAHMKIKDILIRRKWNKRLEQTRQQNKSLTSAEPGAVRIHKDTNTYNTETTNIDMNSAPGTASKASVSAPKPNYSVSNPQPNYSIAASSINNFDEIDVEAPLPQSFTRNDGIIRDEAKFIMPELPSDNSLDDEQRKANEKQMIEMLSLDN